MRIQRDAGRSFVSHDLRDNELACWISPESFLRCSNTAYWTRPHEPAHPVRVGAARPDHAALRPRRTGSPLSACAGRSHLTPTWHRPYSTLVLLHCHMGHTHPRRHRGLCRDGRGDAMTMRITNMFGPLAQCCAVPASGAARAHRARRAGPRERPAPAAGSQDWRVVSASASRTDDNFVIRSALDNAPLCC
jgi:hypothetical protein